MKPDSIIRVIEMIHAIKIFIETANRLTDEDIRVLELMAKIMNGETNVD